MFSPLESNIDPPISGSVKVWWCGIIACQQSIVSSGRILTICVVKVRRNSVSGRSVDNHGSVFECANGILCFDIRNSAVELSHNNQVWCRTFCMA